MSMCVLGMAEEFKPVGIAANALWPQTAIITAAMEMLGGKEARAQCREVDIMSDAAYVILTRDARYFTGNFVIDEAILREEGVTDFEPYACEPGSSLIPDFFLDEVEDPLDVVNTGKEAKARFVGGVDTQKAAAPPPPPAASSPAPAAGTGGGSPIDQLFDKMAGELNEGLVKNTKSVFAFNVTGDDAGKYFLDLKNGAGACGKGEAGDKVDCTMTMSAANFTKMFSGKMSPTSAFMTGKLKIEGNMGKAMKLEKLMGKMQKRGYHTQARSLPGYGSVRHYSDNSFPYKEVEQVFDKLKQVASPEIVSKVDAVYVFDVEDKGKWHVDLKTGSGSVGQGIPQEKADVTITINEKNFLKMFNRELKPATAFMSGKLKLSGDLAKAMALETVMKETRDRSFHTLATQRRSSCRRTTAVTSSRNYSEEEKEYTTVPQVFERISMVRTED